MAAPRRAATLSPPPAPPMRGSQRLAPAPLFGAGVAIFRFSPCAGVKAQVEVGSIF